MIRNLLFALAALVCAGSATAQVQINKGDLLVKKSSKLNNARKSAWVLPNAPAMAKSKAMKLDANKLAAAAPSQTAAPMTRAAGETMWWSYPSSGSLTLYSFHSYGYDSYNLAMIIPPTLAGAVIDSIGVYFYDGSTISNLKVWVDAAESAIPTTAEEADVYASVPSSEISGFQVSGNSVYLYPTQVALPQSFTVPAGGCIIGYSFDHTYSGTGDYEDYPIIVDPENETEGGFLACLDGQWTNFYTSGFGNLTMSIHVQLDNVAESYQVAPTDDITELPYAINEESTVGVNVMNYGINPISTVAYTVSYDGTSTSGTYTFEEGLQSYETQTLPVNVTPTIEGVRPITVSIDQVDGHANEVTAPYNTTTGNMLVIANPATRVSFVEQITGTWCGWCPRGHVGMEMLQESLGDKVICVSGHSDDPMACEDYATIVNMAGGAPVAIFDRAMAGDPYNTTGYNNGTTYQFDTDLLVQAIAASYPSEMGMTLTANWADDAANTINANIEATFAVDRSSSPYSVALILTEDGMTGTGDDWLQTNYYSDEYAQMYQQYYGQAFTQADVYKNQDMAEWISGSMAQSTTYDDVVVAAWDVLNGEDAGFEAPLIKGTTDSYSRTLNISGNTLIQNKGNLSLTAIIINTNNSLVVNAARVKLADPTGIEQVGIATQEATEVARYSVNGQKITAPVKGLNIVKLSDGTSKKVMVK